LNVKAQGRRGEGPRRRRRRRRRWGSKMTRSREGALPHS